MSSRLVATLFAALLLGSACGPSGGGDGPLNEGAPPTSDGSGGGICSPEVTEGCDPVPGEDGGDTEGFTEEQARQEAQGLLGMYESDLPSDVRVGRRGSEFLALTEDYQIGRRTVELDDTDGTGFRVFAVSIELPDGPEKFTLQPG